MPDTRPIGGKNAYIYISGAALTGANGWSIGMTKDAIEAVQFGDTWKRKVWGQVDGTGSITAWQYQDRRLIMDAVAADGPVATYIYPDTGDATNYFSGAFIYTGYTGDGSVTTPVAGSGDFVSFAGSDGILATGFA